MPSDKYVPKSSPQEAELAAQWQPLPSSKLWEILAFGLNEQIDKVDSAITYRWQEELTQIIKDWFGIAKTDLDPKILKKLEPKLKEYKVLKKTVQVPLDWKIDEKLLQSMVKLAIDQIK